LQSQTPYQGIETLINTLFQGAASKVFITEIQMLQTSPAVSPRFRKRAFRPIQMLNESKALTKGYRCR
jgi:hypothetical protein